MQKTNKTQIFDFKIERDKLIKDNFVNPVVFNNALLYSYGKAVDFFKDLELQAIIIKDSLRIFIVENNLLLNEQKKDSSYLKGMESQLNTFIIKQVTEYKNRFKIKKRI